MIFEFTAQVNKGGLLTFVFELAAFFGVTMLCILIVQGVRRIPIQFAKRMVGRGNANIPQSGARDYIPLKVNAAGVMPIIFAQAILLPANDHRAIFYAAVMDQQPRQEASFAHSMIHSL